MKFIDTIPSGEMLIGKAEFAGDPAPINRRLYFGEWEWDPLFKSETMVVEVGGPHAIEYYNRFFAATRITCPQLDIWFRLPFYRSSGMATPGHSPKGMWWPTAGLSSDGFIRKELWSLRENRWLYHRKKRENIPSPLLRICNALNGE